jgi:uncharacterized protein with GYD domain
MDELSFRETVVWLSVLQVGGLASVVWLSIIHSEQGELEMPKYLIQGSYVGEGLKGLLKEGGSNRRAAVEAVIKGMGGTLESFYYAFGEDDVLGVAEFPDNAAAAAFSLAVNASGTVKVKTTVLMAPEEVDEATKRTVDFRPPGR